MKLDYVPAGKIPFGSISTKYQRLGRREGTLGKKPRCSRLATFPEIPEPDPAVSQLTFVPF
jgi:hypothetical protein